jgi:Flp pilus assembly protein TadD
MDVIHAELYFLRLNRAVWKVISDSMVRKAALLCVSVCWLFAVANSAYGQQAASEANSDLQSMLVEGSQALQRGDNAGAEAAFRRALAAQPQSIEIMNDLAIALARQAKEAEAITIYRQALKIRPGDPITTRNLGIAYFKAQRYKDALPLLEAFAKSTQSFQAFELTGLTLFALDRYSEAAQYLERASQVQPEDLQTLGILAKAYFKAGKYQAVADVFARIMAIDPNSAEAHTMMGMAYDKMARDDEAEAEYEAAEKVDPHYMGVHSGLGIIYWKRGKIDQAITEFKAELSRYPADPVSNYLLGEILNKQNQPADAAPHLKAAIAADPKYKEAFFELGKCEVMLKQPKEAVEPLRRAIALDGNYTQAHYMLATALRQLGLSAEATRELQIVHQIQAKQEATDIRHVSGNQSQ